MKRIAAFIIMLLTAVLLPHTAVRAAEQENGGIDRRKGKCED